MARSPSREPPAYRCTECDYSTVRWMGRCPQCRAWGTVKDVSGIKLCTGVASPVSAPARRIVDVDAGIARGRRSGVDELDRVLGGGLVPGAVVLLAGEPGIGKSTLLLKVASVFARANAPTLYVTGEESSAQVRARAERIGALDRYLYLAAETDLSAVLRHVNTVTPSLLIVDSVQAVACAGVEGAPGGISQIRQVAATLIRVAKERDIATVIAGHVTKDGAIAGPHVLEHLVDVVLQFEGDRHARLRMLRAVKNRYGPTDEVGCFELDGEGIRGLPDPSGLFLSRRHDPVAGTCVTVTLDGRRPLVAEVQALVAPTSAPIPRRITSGLESARVAMVLAVLERRGGIRLSNADIYTATIGGARLTEPAVDLAVALAVAGAGADCRPPVNLVAVGEVGLAGEVRRVAGVQRRLTEAARLGFTRALVPPDPGTVPDGVRVTEVSTIREALRALLAQRHTPPGIAANPAPERTR